MERFFRLAVGWLLAGAAAFGVGVTGMFLLDRYTDTTGARPAHDVLASRFPDTALPVIERSDLSSRGARLASVPIPAGLAPRLPPMALAVSGSEAPENWSPNLGVDEFLRALNALTPPPMPTRADAVFNDTQIAAIRDRLKLTREQQREWPPLEAALRGLSWERRRGVSTPELTPDSLERLRDSSGGLLARLTPLQKQEIRMLTRIVGLNVPL